MALRVAATPDRTVASRCSVRRSRRHFEDQVQALAPRTHATWTTGRTPRRRVEADLAQVGLGPSMLQRGRPRRSVRAIRSIGRGRRIDLRLARERELAD